MHFYATLPFIKGSSTFEVQWLDLDELQWIVGNLGEVLKIMGNSIAMAWISVSTSHIH